MTLASNRYAYWRVALQTFEHQPVRGVGAGGWAVYWLQHRPSTDFAQDAHSLPLQTMAELGVVGLALLITLVVGVAMAARRALRRAPARPPAPIAGSSRRFAHALIDWDWQMPAVTLIAFGMAGLLGALMRKCGGGARRGPRVRA